MLRLKYKLYNGTQPQDAIVEAVPSINQETDLWMGQFMNDSNYMYGEINTDSGNQSTLETALANWNVVFLTDNEAKTYVDNVLPADTVIQKKITVNAASIVDDHVIKTYTEWE